MGKGLRSKLEESFTLSRIDQVEAQHSKDGTVKCAFQIDGDAHRVVEGVLIPNHQTTHGLHQFASGMQLGVQVLRDGQAQTLEEPDGRGDV